MSYSVYDSRGFVGDLATNSGWAEFIADADGEGDMLAQLAEEGCADDPEALAEELAEWKASGNVEKTRRNLLALAKRCKDVVIVSDGAGVED